MDTPIVQNIVGCVLEIVISGERNKGVGKG